MKKKHNYGEWFMADTDMGIWYKKNCFDAEAMLNFEEQKKAFAELMASG